MKKRFHTIKRGFTLVELIAAMAITSILVLVIVSLTSKGVDIWRWVVNDVRTTSQARAAIDTLVTDLESIQLRAGNPYEWLLAERDRDFDSATSRSTDMKMGPPGMNFTNASRLVFFTTALDRTPAIPSGQAASAAEDNISRKVTSGDINCVGYKLEYRDQILNKDASENEIGFPVYALYRNLIPAYRTFDDLLGRDNLYEAYRRYETTETRQLNFLVENIVEMTLVFEVDYQTRRGETDSGENQVAYREIENIPLIATGRARTNSYRRVSIYGNRLRIEKQSTTDEQMAYGNIVGLSISLTVVTDEGMSIVDEVRRGRRPPPQATEFFQKYTKQFSQRITIPKPN